MVHLSIMSLCASHAEEGYGLTWRTLDVAPEIANALTTSSGAQALRDAQVGFHRSKLHIVHKNESISEDAPTETLTALLQTHLARIGICLAYSRGGPQSFGQLDTRAAAAANVDAREPATLILFGGRNANVEHIEHVFRR